MNLQTVLMVAGGIVLLLLAAFLVYAYRTRGPQDTPFIVLLRASTWLYVRAVHRVRVANSRGEPLPREGACILVSNHRSGVDPVILSVVTHRRVRFLMAREYYRVPIVNYMFRALGCIPVNRDGNDLGATKEALRALRSGEVIGVFPQGGIREAGAPMEGKEGIGLLALRTGAPVLPFYVEGSPNYHSVARAILTPSRTTVRVGSLLRFETPPGQKPSRLDMERVTAEVLRAIESLGAAADSSK